MKSKKLFNILPLVVLFCLASCGGNMNNKPENSAMMEKNKETTKKMMDMWASANLDNMNMYVVDNMVEHTPDPMIKSTGLEGMKEMAKMYHGAFPDTKMSIMDVWADGNKVIVHSNIKATNSGPMGSMPATNKSVDVNGIDVFAFNEEGKATDHWGYYEDSKMMTQLGLMPGMNEGDPSKMAMDDKMKMDDKSKMSDDKKMEQKK